MGDDSYYVRLAQADPAAHGARESWDPSGRTWAAAVADTRSRAGDPAASLTS